LTGTLKDVPVFLFQSFQKYFLFDSPWEKLGANSEVPKHLLTVHGVGYKLNALEQRAKTKHFVLWRSQSVEALVV
jgi:hypothetical protein